MNLKDIVQRKDKPTQKFGQSFIIETQEQLDHHRDLEVAGLTYKIMPRVYKSDGVCLNCEG